MQTFILMMFAAVALNAALLVLLWMLGKRLHNYGIVDVAWSLLVFIDSLLFTTTLSGYGPRKFLLIFLVLVWALRLSFQIFYRFTKHTMEDTRYSALRQKWGEHADQQMLKFYLLQGVGAVIFSLPAYFVACNREIGLDPLEWIAAILFFASVGGEAMADLQLAKFKTTPTNKDKTCRAGLWSWSRHPNYFFEWLNWCALFLFALPSPFGWITIVCPAAMYHFLNNVTGIPMAEAQSLKSRPEDYRLYQQQVSRFFPWPPRAANKKL